jgi:ATP-dependent DNA helicase PIF1
MNAADEAFFARREARAAKASRVANTINAATNTTDPATSPADTSDSQSAGHPDVRKSRRSLGRGTDPDDETLCRNRKKKKKSDQSRKIDESLSSLASFRKSMAHNTSRIAKRMAEEREGGEREDKSGAKQKKKKKHRSPVVLTSPIAERDFPTIVHGNALLSPSPDVVDRISQAKSDGVSRTLDGWKSKKKKVSTVKKCKHGDTRHSESSSSSSSSSSPSSSSSRRTKTKEKENEHAAWSKHRKTHEVLEPKATAKTKEPKATAKTTEPKTKAKTTEPKTEAKTKEKNGLLQSYMYETEEVVKLSFSDDDDSFLRGGSKPTAKTTEPKTKAKTTEPKTEAKTKEKNGLLQSYMYETEEIVKLSFSDDDDSFLRGGSKPGLKRTQTVDVRAPTSKKAVQRRMSPSSSSRSPVRKAVAISDLSKDQQRVYRMTVDLRKNVLMLGEGGTGKTELIKLITKKCKGLRIKVEVTASTGKAALLIGGSTLHSFAGVKKGHGSVAELLALVRGNRYCRNRWRATKLLILDEVSMISAELLYKLDRIARAIRPGGAKKPFGGMQILASGDFLQLPPVKADYCFKHECFDQIFPVAQRIVLTHNFRQDKDPEFREVLQAIRWGNVSGKADALMQSRVGVLPPDDQPASIIFPLRRQVDELNKEKMAELKDKVHAFKYEFFSLPGCSAKQVEYFHNILLESTPVARGEKFHGNQRGVLDLKIGARVMHTCNNKETGKVNGSLGTIEGFEAVTGNPVVKWADGTRHKVERHTWATNCKKAMLIQYPLIVAWAITVHKAQGATLDAAIIDLGPSIFEYNQAYTAASRVRRLKDLYLLNWQRRVARPHYEALKFYADLGVTLAQHSIALGTAKADFDSRQQRTDSYEARSSSSASSAFSQQFDHKKKRSCSPPLSPPPSQQEMVEAMSDFGVSVQDGSKDGGVKKRARKATAGKKKEGSFVEHEFLMFAEYNGREGEEWFRYFLGAGVDVDSVTTRLNTLNKATAAGTGLDSMTRFSVEPATAITVAMSKMDDEFGCVKVHKVFAKTLDQSKLTNGTNDELFNRLHKCGVESCVE